MENIELMGICQRLALEASNVLKSADPASPPAPESSSVENDIRGVLHELGWPDISPTAVASMAGVLDELSASGYQVGPDTIRRHIQSLAEVASKNTSPITDDLSRDRICIEVMRGITMHNRLLITTSALVHASLSAMPRSPQNSAPETTKFE
ncbi:MAG: hypothetical protein ACTIL6_09095 [Brevibacterium aurantiacum]|uniref:Uncharacterized protein n=1 Tax=Brevibacterium aurantiacum TaxID=273384 RepID=A0A2A3ZIK2_BREAU|nr:hypothetical protein [Brevibacterium aurantiacum]PCC51354.1 hypothetical protein CIK62_02230 [Brevibacterium aurantiacum]